MNPRVESVTTTDDYKLKLVFTDASNIFTPRRLSDVGFAKSGSLTLGPDECLVLGDNTRNSLDGRCFDPIKWSAIIGKAFYIYAPADRQPSRTGSQPVGCAPLGWRDSGEPQIEESA